MTNPGLNYKRGILVPGISALAVAAVVSSRSSAPVLTFLTLIVASGAGVAIGILLMVEVRRPTKAPDALGLAYGGFWLRFAAYLIDVLTIGIPAAVLTAMNSSLIVLAYVVLPVYFVVLWATTGRTFGMVLFGLRVVRSADGGRVGLRRAMLRLVGFLFAAVPLEIGLVWAAFDVRKRGWHDMVAGTVVIREMG
jgi:RDD family.